MKKAENELNKILNDKLHGSTDILDQVYDHILRNKSDINYLLKASKKISQKLSHFPVITNFLKDLENILMLNDPKTLNDFLNNFGSNEANKYARFFENEMEVLSKLKTVLTISHSRTLINVFNHWKKSFPKLKIIICESRPLNEGILMAKELSELKIRTEIITEAMSAKIIDEVDAVILGADQILNNGNIVNKTGSRMLAILAKHHKLPVYVIASPYKIVKKKIIQHEKPADKSLLSKKSKWIKFRNDNFEGIEKELITKILLVKS